MDATLLCVEPLQPGLHTPLQPVGGARMGAAGCVFGPLLDANVRENVDEGVF